MTKVRKVVVSAILLFLVTAQLIYAQGSWGDARTFSLSADVWEIRTTEGSWVSSYKTTNSSNFDVHTISKTMWTNPSVRIVNSNRQVRSNPVTVRGGRTVTGYNNTGEIGYYYYGEVRKYFSQIGTDTIRIQIRVR